MSAILLPTKPLPQSATPKPLDYGSWQEPVMGGPITRVDRLGSRLAIDIVMPRMKPEPNGRIWVARLLASIGATVQLPFPQVGFVVGNQGDTRIDGNIVGGTSLPIKGATAGYVFREGQFFNVYDSAARAYLHAVIGGDVAVGSDGKAILTVWPMFRVQQASNNVANFGAPVIEGRLSGNEAGWTLERAGTRGLQFTITELR